jgi:uncharacterized protein involved in exopolysaccharide biosynthesis
MALKEADDRMVALRADLARARAERDEAQNVAKSLNEERARLRDAYAELEAKDREWFNTLRADNTSLERGADGLMADLLAAKIQAGVAKAQAKRLTGLLKRCQWHVERTWRESQPMSEGLMDWTALLAEIEQALAGQP